MKITLDEFLNDFEINKKYKNADFYLNGQLVSPIEIDTDIGYVDIHRVHNHRMIVMNNRCLVDRLFGKVEINHGNR